MEELKIEGLYARYYPGEGDNVIIMHGLLSSMGEFFDYPEKINSHGYNVIIFDFSGHGKSKGIRGYESMDKNLDDLKKILNFVKMKNPSKRIILLGHSLGAATVIYALARNMGDLGIAIAPPSSIKDEMKAAERILLPVIYFMGRLYELVTKKKFYIKYRADYEGIYRKIEVIKKAKKVGFLGDKIWIGSYKPLMKINVLNEAKRVGKPCLIVVPTEDKLVSPEHGKMVYKNLKGKKEIYFAKGYNHSVMGEDTGEILQKIVEFINENSYPT